MTALSNMAAAARPPGIGDARVPCPLCGGLIHPVAGRCKHCKEDLTSFRAGRPQAATPLPSLVAPQPARNGSYGHVVAAEVPIAVPVREASQPILPPRPTGRSLAAQRPRGSLADKWPLIVIGLAVIALVGAVVIMVLPEDKARSSGKRNLMPTPAPDRMDTNPVPPQKQSQNDPWADPDFVPDPGRDPRMAPDPGQPDPPPPDDDDDDLLGGLGGGGGTGGLGFGGSLGGMSGTFMLTMIHQACQKAQSCPNVDQSMLGPLCSQFSALPRPPVPRSCAPALRCLSAIDKLDCDAGLDNPLGAIALIQDCTKAATEC